MWLAHLLTLLRIPLAALFWAVADRPLAAIAVIALAAFTDVVDGTVARVMRTARGEPEGPGQVGAWLDPLCDKLFVVSVLAATWVILDPPAIHLVAIAAREIVLVPLAIAYRLTPSLRSRMRYDFRAGPVGKATTLLQFVAIVGILFRQPWGGAAAWLAGAVGLAAAAHYIARGVRLARETLEAWGGSSPPRS